MRSNRRHAALGLASLLVLAGPVAVAAADATPPVGTVEFHDIDRPTQNAEFRLAYSDPESALVDVIVSCDGGAQATYAYQTTLFVPVTDPTAGGCAGYGYHVLKFNVRNSAGGLSADQYESVPVYPFIWLETPLSPVTGQPFTFRPVFPDDYTIPPGSRCIWEFRWGSSYALSTNAADGTLGGVGFVGPAAQYCVDWTFTLPWAPVSQYQVTFALEVDDVQISSASIGFVDDGRPLITAAIDSTSRHINSSTIPLVYILPNTFVVNIGESVTYTRYKVNSPSVDDSATRWVGRSNDSADDPSIKTQTGGSTFTYSPDRTGEWTTDWDYESGARRLIAYLDPRVNRSGSDTTAPTVTPPVQRLGGRAIGSGVPTTLTWGGLDGRSGVDRFVLQRSTDAGAWSTIALPSKLSTSLTQELLTGHTYRFRVRAIDRAGNRSAWTTGPSFAPQRISEANSAIAYVGSWTTVSRGSAIGGVLRSTNAAGARANYTFTARDVAWVAEAGPTRGKVDIYVDGGLVKTVDLYALSVQPRAIVFTRHWSTLGTHTISIRNKATFARPGASLDAFLLLR